MKSLKAKFRKSDTHEWNKNDDRLLQAVENGDAEKVSSLLVKKGVSATKQDSEGKSAFHLAAIKGQAECLGTMLTHGVDLTSVDSVGRTALHLAAKNSHPECIKRLFQYKCPVENTDSGGRTALHYAAECGCLSVVQLLCEQKSPINVKDLEGYTPLLCAAQKSHDEVCKYLTDHGADINTRDKNGKTSLMLACENGSRSTLESLMGKGADLKLVDALGHDALHYAKLSGNAEIQNLLQDAVTKSSQDTGIKTPTKLKQLDEISKLSSGSGTPKKRKAPPPPPFSPSQSCPCNDTSSPRSRSSSPVPGKESSGDHVQEDEKKNSALIEEIQKLQEEKAALQETINNFKHVNNSSEMQVVTQNATTEEDRINKNTVTNEKGTQSLPSEISSSQEMKNMISLLQEKISVLTLQNIELQEKLQDKTYRAAELDNSFDSNGSFYSTQTEFDQSADVDVEKLAGNKKRESLKSPSIISDTLSKMESHERLINHTEDEIRQLQEVLKNVQMKLQDSEVEKKLLQDQLQSTYSKTNQVKPENVSENGCDLSEELRETRTKYEEALKEISRLQQQIKSEHIPPPNLEDLETLSVKEADILKQQLAESLKETERQKQIVKDLEGSLQAVRESVADKIAVEECEAIKNSFNAIIENIKQEKNVLLKNYEDGQQEIKKLQEALGAKERNEEHDKVTEVTVAMQKHIGDLQARVDELTQLHSKSQDELAELRSKQSNELSCSYIQKEEHERMLEAMSESSTRMQEKVLELEVKYEEAVKEAAQLKKDLEAQKENSILKTKHIQVVTALRETVHEMEEQIYEFRDLLTKKDSEVRDLQKLLLDERTAVSETVVSKASYEQLKSTMETEVKLLVAKLEEAKDEEGRLTVEVAQRKTEVQQLRNEKQTAQSLLDSKEQEINELHKTYHQTHEALMELKKISESSAKLEEDKDKKISELSKEVSKLKEALNSLSQLSYTTSTPKRQNQQLDILQQQVKQLQHQLVETKKQHQDIISVYRMHLLYAVQGQMDEDVQKVLKQILTMCKGQTHIKS
ncbi:ankycorbin [Protopterus annectens]|uniref:ankycorbin n=1 Tax=Protopterus annectens TaxID=7888 RepID=UPI001CFACF69|nr:ankycorbin [Protopterus annectens]